MIVITTVKTKCKDSMKQRIDILRKVLTFINDQPNLLRLRVTKLRN